MAMAGREENIYILSRTRSPESSRGYINPQTELATLLSVPDFDVGFLLTLQPEDSGIPIAEPCYCTPGGVFVERRSVLAFSFGERNSAETFAAGIIKVSHTFMIMLAIRLRQAADGSRRFNFYCQVVPRTLVSGTACGLQLSDIVREVESRLVDIEQDIDFSSDGVLTVALGNMIPYSSTSADHGQLIKVVHVVSGNACRSAALREDTDSNISLLF
jgi:hypothetical protein